MNQDQLSRAIDELLARRAGANVRSSAFAFQNFVYTSRTTDGTPIAAAAEQEAKISIQADSDFIWLQGAYYATIANAAYTDSARPIPSVTLQIVDTGSGRQFFDNPVPIPSIFGTGEFPFTMPIPQIFRLNSTLQLTYNNFDAAVAYNVRLALIGVKVFATGPSPSY